VDEGRTSLLMSAFVKIPMQFGILFIGVMVFVFYLFVQPPMIFKQDAVAQVQNSPHKAEFDALQKKFDVAWDQRMQSASSPTTVHDTNQNWFIKKNQEIADIRKQAAETIKKATNTTAFSDTNYVFPTFVTTYMPAGVVGLIIAAIFAAAMSSISAELSALSTATVIDFYRRHINTTATDTQYLRVAKLATGLWGIFACIVALYASRLGSLIEVVNKFGSYFYGSLLGVFVLALGTKRATGTGAFVGLFAGIASVALVSNYTNISFLWYNLVGCVAVFVVGIIVSLFTRKD
jgi:Na+(H+)/acetate symporter ActP